MKLTMGITKIKRCKIILIVHIFHQQKVDNIYDIYDTSSVISVTGVFDTFCEIRTSIYILYHDVHTRMIVLSKYDIYDN